MIEITEGRPCEICGEREAVVICNGCQKALCEACRVFDIWGYGCGHGNPMVFCRNCDADPQVNLWKPAE